MIFSIVKYNIINVIIYTYNIAASLSPRLKLSFNLTRMKFYFYICYRIFGTVFFALPAGVIINETVSFGVSFIGH